MSQQTGAKQPDTRRRTHAGEAGQLIIIVAFAIIALFAMVGLAIDAGRLYITKAELSRAVDSAALSGILEFDGTVGGLTRGELACEQYFELNEPDANEPDCEPIAADNEMTVDASKTVEMAFLSVLGVEPVTVAAHARAGFGVQFLDAAMIIDATGSMDDGCNDSQNNSSCPIYEAKEAAKDFKDILLGTSPEGNTAVGVTAMRGCFRANPQTATAPKPTSEGYCVLESNDSSSWVTGLTYNLGTLDTQIGNIFAQGGSGTNPCGGLAKGWEVLEGPGNHMAEEDNLRYLILLSDGDSNYYGHYTYQGTPYASPHTYQTHPCQVPSSCSDSSYDVGGESTRSSDPCQNGVYQPAITVAEEDFNGPSSSCPSGTNWNFDSDYGWADTSWTVSASNIIKTSSSSPRDTSCHIRIAPTGWMCRSIDLTAYEGGTLRFYAKDSDNWDSGDYLRVQVSDDANACTTLTGFDTLLSIDSGDIDDTYSNNDFSLDLEDNVGQVVHIRFLGDTESSTEYAFVDSIEIEAGDTGSSNGYVNGHNGSPANCSTAVKRERQLDMLTWEMTQAIEADGIEIVVVGFGVCDPEEDDIVFTDAQCDSLIGNTDHDDTADERLLKCIASSPTGTNDTYYSAATASDLNAIFTEIASQIAHRLIE